jgi:hypothetical protein
MGVFLIVLIDVWQNKSLKKRWHWTISVWILDFGFWILDFGFCILEIGINSVAAASQKMTDEHTVIHNGNEGIRQTN